MKTPILILSFFILGIWVTNAQNIESFNADWKFSVEEVGAADSPNFDDSNWKVVTLPHDASITGRFDKTNSTSANGWLPFQQGWYRKSFKVENEDKGKKVFIQFDGVYHSSKVWINGNYLGRNLNGYLGFEYDLTPFVKWGKDNVIAVHFDNLKKQTSRWYTGAGIYRDVWLKVVNPLYVPQSGTRVTTPFLTKDLARVTVETEIVNETKKPGEISIETEIINPKGETVATKKAVVHLEFFNEYTFKQELKVDNPELWDTEVPNLYFAKSTLFFNGEKQDEYLTRFGIRTIELTPEKGLLLNGKKVFAQGGDIHHDLACVGAAALKSGYKYRLQLLKDMGCNSLRLSHNPHAPVLLDVCDEMGILVINEAYDKWTSQYFGGEKSFKEAWPSDMETFIKRDRNHPSIFLWSVGNEVRKQLGNYDPLYETKDDASDFGAGYLKELVAFTHSLDPTRKVTAGLFPARAETKMEWNDWDNHDEFMKTLPPPMAFHMDVVSWNYTGNFFDLDYKNYPQMMFLASEASTNFDFGNRKISMLEFDKEHVIGHYYWTALSYLGESAWPRKSWQRAFYDACEQLTPIGYIYKSLYVEEPMLKIMVKENDAGQYDAWDKHFPNKRWSWYPMLDHWNFQNNTQLEVQAFTNCDEVELVLNGKSLGSKKIDKGEEPILYWEVSHKAGQLIALGKRYNSVVVSDTLSTAEKAANIVLEPNTKTLKANGADLVYIQVSLKDKNGIVVPDKKQITFEVSGPSNIAGVANSDIFSDEPWQGNSRTTIGGRCLLVLRSTNKAGEIEIVAKTIGMKTALLNMISE